ncbi:hypothetical protein [Leptothoe spongobia]|uniref:Secreted protein n=1 Tax=Leptothoe spongobia TAU-MAC 1115 TaxID=1967444 RepID=A0A947GL51_9CYAN|nr:hypothetical protein [Leptothoe spongobia]MBT9317037.1 hypothetical protein [Leptothoe spongobia TAU-MAC 1115]
MLCFKLHPLVAFSLLLTTLYQHPAHALGVSFDLGTQSTASVSARVSDQTSLKADTPESHPIKSALPQSQSQSQSLPIPPPASQPPVRMMQSPKGSPNKTIAAARLLPPPPEALPTTRVLRPNTPKHHHQAMGLNFDPEQSIHVPTTPQKSVSTSQQPDLPQWLYEGGSNSLVARVIGSAEGTRTPNGQPTRAYYGHTDPGNGVWNMGTFSYQHGAHSPQEADRKQLKRLKKQGKTMAKQANQAGLSMTLDEILNGLDLANQSPKAALERGGYIDRLAQAREKVIDNREAIVWARTYAYLDPDTQRWNAPGLGNTLPSIKQDQSRRHEAITQAFSSYQAQQQKPDEPIKDTLKVPAIALVPPPVDIAVNAIEETTEPQRARSSRTESATFNQAPDKLANNPGEEPSAHVVSIDTKFSAQAKPLEFSMTENNLVTQPDNETAITPTINSELSPAAISSPALEKSSQTSS